MLDVHVMERFYIINNIDILFFILLQLFYKK